MTYNDVLFSILKCMRPNGRTDQLDVMKDLSISDDELYNYTRHLELLEYICTDLEGITITSSGLAYLRRIE